MSIAASTASGKGRATENFPVASRVIAAAYRPPILAYYRFARAADDIADHPALASQEKLRRLDVLRRALNGELSDDSVDPLRRLAAARGLDLVHAHHLLDAFSQDAVKTRYRDYPDLLDYCVKSAMPVGRFVLEVHGEDRATWPASDALCAALQIINHLQDCADDFRALDRVYLPCDYLDQANCGVSALSARAASPQLRKVIDRLLDDTEVLLSRAGPLAGQVRDSRLKLEVAIIQIIAETLVRRLRARDPLASHVKLSGASYAWCFARGLARWIFAR